MDIVFFTEQELYKNQQVCRGCEEIVREAQEQGCLNTALYMGDFGTYVAFDSDEVIGYLSLSVWCDPQIEAWWKDGKTVYVEQVVVKKNCRGHGVARALYEVLQEDDNFSRIICSVAEANEQSCATHEALGFYGVNEHDGYVVYVKNAS